MAKSESKKVASTKVSKKESKKVEAPKAAAAPVEKVSRELLWQSDLYTYSASSSHFLYSD